MKANSGYTILGYSKNNFGCCAHHNECKLGRLSCVIEDRDPQATRENYKRLKDLVPNANIYPVWQIEDSIASLEELSQQDHEIIAIGGVVPYLSTRFEVVRRKFREVFSRFPNINFHFLGGANELLLEFEFFSSDTTAFLNSRKSERKRKVYKGHGERIDAPKEMSVMEIIRQNISYLTSLEKRYEAVQGSILD